VRHLPRPRTLLAAALLAVLAALTPTSSASAEPQDQRKQHGSHEKSDQPTKHHRPGKHKKTKTIATPSPTAVPSASPEPAVLGPTAPARPSPTPVRVLSGHTLGALSYADARPIPRRTTAAAAGTEKPLTVTWPPHDRREWPVVAASVRSVVDHPTAPLLVGALIGLFLLVQSRLDRYDPKLTRDPGIYPPDLRFGPAVRSKQPVR
jgi:hypothetical protein